MQAWIGNSHVGQEVSNSVQKITLLANKQTWLPIWIRIWGVESEECFFRLRVQGCEAPTDIARGVGGRIRSMPFFGAKGHACMLSMEASASAASRPSNISFIWTSFIGKNACKF